MSAPSVLKVGVVGLGFGRCHVRTIKRIPGARVVAVTEREPERQGVDFEAYSRKHDVRTYREAADMVAREELDAVVICVSPRYRAEVVDIALQRSLPMLVEKPFASNEEHGRALSELCARSRAPVMVDFCLRYLPAVVELRKLLDGPLGAPLLVNADLMIAADPPGSWVWATENGNGVVNENTCHLFDLLCALLGEPVEVYAAGGAFLGNPLEDGVAVTLRFAGGRVAVLTGGGLAAEALETPTFLSIYTARGQARVTGIRHMYSELAWAAREGGAAERQSWELPAREEIAYYALQHFFDCVRGGRAPETGLAEGMRALRLAMAVRRSLEAGAPVALGG